MKAERMEKNYTRGQSSAQDNMGFHEAKFMLALFKLPSGLAFDLDYVTDRNRFT
jgi:hypothetical protein